MAESWEPQEPSHRPEGGVKPTQTSSAADLYRQGVAAFKQGLNQTALARFQQLTQLPAATPQWRLKGQMGLVLTQQRLGRIDQAREGCQQVLASPIPEARQWAESVLAKLPPLTTPIEVSPEATLQTPKKALADSATAPSGNASGFGADLTGFIPLEPVAQPSASTNAAKPIKGVDHLTTGVPPGSMPSPNPSLELATELTPEETTPPPSAGSSLFHYQHLNQDANSVPQVDRLSVQGATNQEFEPPATQDPPTGDPLPPRPAPLRVKRPLPLPTPYGLWGAQIVTMLVVLWATPTGLHLLLRGVNTVLRRVTWPLRLGGIAWLDRTYTGPVIALLLGLIITSPWWMDILLERIYGQRVLTPRQVQGLYPEFLKQLRQQCQQQGWYLPELRLLPDGVPLCFSYGWRPRHLRIVISQGLLDSGDGDLLTTLCTYELAHMMNRSTAVISGLGSLLLLLHTVYRALAHMGETPSSRWLRLPLKALAQVFYGLFWTLRRGLLWLSRLRSGWADRRVDALLQRPDLQQRSLCWLAQQLPAHLAQRGTLPPLWWSLDVLMPLSPHGALSPGSFFPALGEAAVTLNDWANPYRHWLVGGASHLPFGERLRWLSQQALQRQQPTLNLVEPMTAPPPPFSVPRLMLQKSPVLGLLAGGGIALGFWFIGGLVMRFGWQRLSWWYQDSSLLYGGLLLGLGVGVLMRINALYPDIPATQPVVSEPSHLLGALDQLPVEGEPCRLSGTLIQSFDAPQGQNVYLATLGGLVKLGFSSPQPGLWELGQTASPFQQWVGRPVVVSGWRRRSDGILWLDVATIGLASQRQTVTIAAPMWTTLVSLSLCLGGIFILWTGA